MTVEELRRRDAALSVLDALHRRYDDPADIADALAWALAIYATDGAADLNAASAIVGDVTTKAARSAMISMAERGERKREVA